MTTTEQSNALAVREMSLSEIGRRIQLAQGAGSYGIQNASAEKLNMLAVYCQRRQLLPVDEVTLYEGFPFITVDGHVTLMRREPEYRNYKQRPLSKSEKEDWGYDPDDIVIETTIHTKTMGEFTEYGRVSAAEREGRAVQGTRQNPVARHHPVEMAKKRSLVRAHRFAFGLDSYVDDDAFEREVRTVIQERNDPEGIAAGAAAYDRIIGSNYDDNLPDERPQVQPAPAQADVEMVKSVRHTSYQELVGLVEALASGGIDTEPFTVKLPVPLSELREKIGQAQQAIEQTQSQVAETPY